MFLGMGNQELYLLGYEDIEEFRNYHNDVADLFINKPGYIFKFKNFSWIDYTLHSGTPNKRVLIKTKSGREIDSSLHIHEIYLTQEIFGSKTCFGIELTNTPFKSEAPIVPTATPTPTVFDTVTMYDEPSPSLSTSTSEISEAISFDYVEPTAPVSFTSSAIEEDYTPPTSFNSPSDTGDFKLKFDSDILDTITPKVDTQTIEPKAYSSIDQIQIKDFDFKPSLESYPDDNYEDLRQDTLLSVKEIHHNTPITLVQNTEELLFDFSLSADSLGLDISTLAILIEEYIQELENKMILIKSFLESNDYSMAKEEIDKLKSVALHLHILPLYTQFEILETSLDRGDQETMLHKLLLVQNVISDLKDSVQ